MKGIWSLPAVAGLGLLIAGCATPPPPGVERGPHGTVAYDILVEASDPGARIEANGQDVGNSPVHIKIYGDTDGTFHDFGAYTYVIRALPLTTNQFQQVRVFQTGHWMTPEDRIPDKVYFDMNKPPPPPPPGAPPYAYPPPPYYYGAPYYYGPSFRFYVGPPHYYRRW